MDQRPPPSPAIQTSIPESLPASAPPEPAAITGPKPLFLVLILGAFGIAGLALFLVYFRGHRGEPGPGPSRPGAWKPETEEDLVVDEFMKRKNVGDPAADDLLGVDPKVPNRELSRAEADALETDFFLHDPKLKITRVWREQLRMIGAEPPRWTGRYVLETRGGYTAAWIPVKGMPRGEQRTVINGFLIVEVRDGKMYGVEPSVLESP
jgi:hypothetical protein